MGEPVTLPAAVEPAAWNVCFHRTAASRFWSLVALGHYKHVSAFAYLPGIRGWLIYDVRLDGTRIAVLPDSAAGLAVIERIVGDCDIIRMVRRPSKARFIRAGFWCVPAIKHLLGLCCGALRPDALWRHCLRNGGEVIGQAGSAANPARPAVRCDAGSG